MISDTKLASC